MLNDDARHNMLSCIRTGRNVLIRTPQTRYDNNIITYVLHYTVLYRTLLYRTLLYRGYYYDIQYDNTFSW